MNHLCRVGLLCIVLNSTFVPLLANMESKEKILNQRKSSASEPTCEWGCSLMDTKLQACETRCLIYFYGKRARQKHCQVKCATRYINCLEICSKTLNYA